MMTIDRVAGDVMEFCFWAKRTNAKYLSVDAETKAARFLVSLQETLPMFCVEQLKEAWSAYRFDGDKAGLDTATEFTLSSMKKLARGQHRNK